jgi:hypothetical protein
MRGVRGAPRHRTPRRRPGRANRSEAIDRAGASSRSLLAGVSARAAGRVTVIVVKFTVIGDLFQASKRGQIAPTYYRQLTGQLPLSGEDAAVFVTAYAIEDTETQRDLLSNQSPCS